MGQFLMILECVTLLVLMVSALAWTSIQFKKSLVKTGVQLQCSSGDSEVMVFNINFQEGESEDSKASKLAEGWQLIQDRRDENHAKWLEMKAKALEENEKSVADGKDLKLKSVTQGNA